jgi:DNA helicase-2/ATP-dependent DNA helicase PcrA
VQVDEVLSGLNDAQRRAVTHPAGPLAIQAGAGSGKTRVLTRRIAYRAATEDLDPRHVVALTFTRKAAGELAQRLRNLGLRDAVTVGTFHAVAFGQLRSRWADRGLSAPTLLQRKMGLVARLLPKGSTANPAEVVGEIEWAKARLVSPRQYPAVANAEGRRTTMPAAQVGEVFAAYEAEKRRRRLVDFDDLLRLACFDLGDDREFAVACHWRHRHFFVDEFQDVNPLQFALLQAWLGNRDDLCVVGDPNQAIYGWNGADAHHLVDFGDYYPTAPTIVLDENHRSTPQVLAVARAVLDGHGGAVATGSPTQVDGAIPEIHAYDDDEAEAAGIARAIRDLHRPGAPWSHQAVLVRTNAQLAPIERALHAADIPCRVRGRAELADDPTTRQVLDRLARMRGAFATCIADLGLELASTDPAVVSGAPTVDDHQVAEAVLAAAEEYAHTDPDATVAGFDVWLRDRGGDDRVRGRDAVELCTFHAAKGLEWPIVHLAGIEQGFVPISHARTPDARAEEQRLLYVAITRAEEVLRVTWARRRTFGERTVERQPSEHLGAVEAAIAGLAEAAAPVDRHASAAFFAAQRARLDDTSDPAPGISGGDPDDPQPEAGADGPDDQRADSGPPAATGRPRLRAVSGSQGRPAHDAPADGRDTPAERGIYLALAEWRAGMARGADVAPSVIFPDRTLTEVARRRPATLDELQAIPGIGPVKVQRYGDALLRVLRQHRTG